MVRTERLLILRSDAGAAIGLGHLQRLRTLAAQAAEYGFTPRFVPESPKGSVPPAWMERLPGGTWVVLDLLWPGNREATVAEVARLRSMGHLVVVIDSMPPDHFVGPVAASPHLLVTPYHNAEKLRDRPNAGRWLHGAGFALLDSSFSAMRATARPLPKPDRMLICCGGSDPAMLSLSMVEVLAESNPQLEVDLVVGPFFSADLITALRAVAYRNSWLELHLAPKTLAPLIAGTSVVVGRLGLLRYEAAVLGRSGVFLHDGARYRDYLDHLNSSGIAEVHFANDPEGREGFMARIVQLAGGMVEHVFNTEGFAAIDGQGCSRLLGSISQLVEKEVL